MAKLLAVARHRTAGRDQVGSWRDKQGVTFAVCHGRRPAVILDLTGQHYDRLVVTVENPGEVAAALA